MSDTPVLIKPREGAHCNGCGLCCALQLCDLAVELLDAEQAPCPAMEFTDGRFWCGLARYPGRYFGIPAFADRFIRPMVHQELGIVQGVTPAICSDRSLHVPALCVAGDRDPVLRVYPAYCGCLRWVARISRSASGSLLIVVPAFFTKS
jgi:hypothetical protein